MGLLVSRAPRLAAALILLALLAPPRWSSTLFAAPEPTVDFNRDIRPILSDRCFTCHGPDEQARKAKLRLDVRAEAIKKAIVPGDAAKSRLFQRITSQDQDEVMPPPESKKQLLTPGQIALFKRWINQDAHYAEHWAFRKPARPATPPVLAKTWVRNPIDTFILARLEREGLAPSPEADRPRLCRRVYLDLIGLPPSPAQVDAFANDTSAAAYEKLVDRLLASPQYGEKWASHWLDLARYADSHGFQRDDLRDIWPFRNWVIRAMNADMPFDQFTIEQIAGDLLPNPTVDQKVATGFHRCTTLNAEAGSDPEENRVNQLIDRVNTTSAVWLGVTMECAQCHNHKYDPFTQRDYYQLFAFFNSTTRETEFSSPDSMSAGLNFVGPHVKVPDPDRDRARAELKTHIAEVEKQIADRTSAISGEMAAWEKQVRADLARTPQPHLLKVAEFQSLAGSSFKTLEDGSVLLTGDAPNKDTYVVTVRTKLTGVAGFKLEALTDASLGDKKGPGRADVPNFVLNNFKVTATSERGEKTEAVKLIAAAASFSQPGFPIERLLMTDNEATAGWAIGSEVHRDHWAVFKTAKPLGFTGETTLTFRLEQDFGGVRTIGRLRLSAFTDPELPVAAARSVPSDIVAILDTTARQRTEAQTKRLTEFYRAEDKNLERMRVDKANLEKSLRELGEGRSLVMEELSEPRSTAIFKRGNFLDPSDTVSPGTPAILHSFKGARPTSGSPLRHPDRLDLANWLVSEENPLVARVTVNRWWAEVFGQGIVKTLEDFGFQGDAPTHMELLNWLAAEFMEHGWSMKHMLKLMVMSNTYRQSSNVSPELLARDAFNQLHGRGPRFRMDAEMIRDNALAIAGLLSLKQGGPPVRPYQPRGLWDNKVGGAYLTYEVSAGGDAYRRGIYTVVKRTVPYPSFTTFDASARTACTIRRSRSNTPLQALTLLNDPVYVEAAKALARRLISERPGANKEDLIRYAFRLCLARNPKVEEVGPLVRLFDEQTTACKTDPEAAKSLIGDFSVPRGTDLPRFVGWYAVASALLNLDEVITKN